MLKRICASYPLLPIYGLVAPRFLRVQVAIVCLALAAIPAAAAPAWTLDPAQSVLTYQSVKKNTIVETNSIRNIIGEISADGLAKVTFDLNSVDTGVDLRNVRMRFLFFETFKYPTAVVTAKLNPSDFTDLATKRRMNAVLPFRLSLHGIEKDYEAAVVVTLITNGMVSVSSKSPIAVNVADFGLLPNVEKLQQAANVTNIVPTASVSFDFVFAVEGQLAPAIIVGATEADADASASATGPVATDTSKAAFTDDECFNRFEVISRTGAIYFRTGSAVLDAASRPLLDSVLDVVTKCPRLLVEVAGHTDSDGPEAANRLLSEQRASSVANFIKDAGVPDSQIATAGYGEDRPIAANDTAKNKALNRRIEFSAHLPTEKAGP